MYLFIFRLHDEIQLHWDVVEIKMFYSKYGNASAIYFPDKKTVQQT